MLIRLMLNDLIEGYLPVIRNGRTGLVKTGKISLKITTYLSSSRGECFGGHNIVCNQRLIGVTYSVPDFFNIKGYVDKLMLGNRYRLFTGHSYMSGRTGFIKGSY